MTAPFRTVTFAGTDGAASAQFRPETAQNRHRLGSDHPLQAALRIRSKQFGGHAIGRSGVGGLVDAICARSVHLASRSHEPTLQGLDLCQAKARLAAHVVESTRVGVRALLVSLDRAWRCSPEHRAFDPKASQCLLQDPERYHD